MGQYKLTFISDENLLMHVKQTAEKYRFSISLAEFKKNIVDPIALTFDTKVQGKSIENVIENEVLRQLDKSKQNHIGYFHQNIFKYLNPEWQVPEHGFDVVNRKRKIFVEIKNKHNTMNSFSSQKTYMRMMSAIHKYAGSSCMLVEVIAKHSQNIPWKMSLDGESVSSQFIRRVSMDKFYEIVTGVPTAFKQLCEVLPRVIDDAVQSEKERLIKNSVCSELKEISPNILKSLYIISFREYEGFDNFNY